MSPFPVVAKKRFILASPLRASGITLSIGVLLAGIAAHIKLGTSAEEYTGPLALLDHIFDISLALGLLIVMLSVGHAVSKKFRVRFASGPEEITFSLFLGAGVIGMSVLCLGLLGLLRPWPIAALMLLLLGLTRRDLQDLYGTLKEGVKAVTLTRERQVLAALFFCLIALFLLRASTPPNTADELIYHLPATKQFVEHGSIYPSYDNALGNTTFLIHMSYAVCLIAGSDIAAKLVSLFLAIATALALYAFCSRFLTRRVGVIAMFSFFAAGMVVEVAVTARIDVSLAGMLFLATYAMMNYLETEHRGWFWLSAMLAGFSLGIKHFAGLWLLLVGIMYLVERLVRKRDHLNSVLKYGIAYTFVAVTIASPWYIKNYVWFHNPVYPFFTGELADFGQQGFRYFTEDDEHRLNSHFETARKEIPEIVNAQEEELIQAKNARPPRHPMRLWEFFTKPHTYLMSEAYHFPNYLFLLIPLLPLLKPRSWVAWLLGLSLGFLFIVTWTSWIARYLLPAYPSLTVVAAYTLTTLSERLTKTTSFTRRLPAYIVAVALATIAPAYALSMLRFNTFGFLSGKISRHEFLIPLPNSRPIDFINTQLPTTARVMIIGVQMNYGIQRDYLTDESWFATKWRRLLVRNSSLEEVNEDLKRQGFTYILFTPRLFTAAAKEGIRGTGAMDLLDRNRNPFSDETHRLGPEFPLLRNWATFTLYQRKFLETVYSDENGYQIFKIK